MTTPYSSTFPAEPPCDPDDPATVARHDQQAFERVDTMLRHWDRPHRRSYHWMITFEQHGPVIELSQRCQRLLPKAGLNLIPPESLHLTVRRLGYLDEVDSSRLRAVLRTVSDRCAEVDAFRLAVIPLAGSPGAVRFSVAPWSPLLELHRIVSAAGGCDAIDPLSVYRPHVGIAYSDRVQPPGPCIEAAHRARTLPPAEVTIDSLQLVELYRADHHYRWRVIERVPLADASSHDRDLCPGHGAQPPTANGN